MSKNVVYLNGITKLDVPAERVLQRALEHGLESVVISGHDKDGNEYFASSVADGGTCLWLIERLKKRLLQIPEDLSD
jgi:hypothetical protein